MINQEEYKKVYKSMKEINNRYFEHYDLEYLKILKKLFVCFDFVNTCWGVRAQHHHKDWINLFPSDIDPVLEIENMMAEIEYKVIKAIDQRSS